MALAHALSDHAPDDAEDIMDLPYLEEVQGGMAMGIAPSQCIDTPRPMGEPEIFRIGTPPATPSPWANYELAGTARLAASTSASAGLTASTVAHRWAWRWQQQRAAGVGTGSRSAAGAWDWVQHSKQSRRTPTLYGHWVVHNPPELPWVHASVATHISEAFPFVGTL